MKEFVEKLIERLEEISVNNTCSDCPYKSRCDEVQEQVNDETTDLCGATIKSLVISIVNQLAEEYNKKYEPTIDLIEYGIDGYNHHLKEHYLKGYENAKKENTWIPCSEKLPEPYTLILVCEENGEIHLCRYHNECHRYFYDGSDWDIKESLVTAWQPLPEPYQLKGE